MKSNLAIVVMLIGFSAMPLLSPTAHATTHIVEYVTTSPYTIGGTLLSIGSGVAIDETITIEDLVASDMGRMLVDANPTVWLDGQQIGLKGTIRVTRRLRGFLDGSDTEGSVAYTYNLRYRGANVTRSTKVTDNRLVLDTTIRGGMGPQLDYARLVIVAIEHDNGTTITGTLTAHTPIGDRSCCIGRRIRRRRGVSEEDTRIDQFIRRRFMHGPMVDVLEDIEREGRRLGTAGAPDLLGVVRLFVERMTK